MKKDSRKIITRIKTITISTIQVCDGKYVYETAIKNSDDDWQILDRIVGRMDALENHIKWVNKICDDL